MNGLLTETIHQGGGHDVTKLCECGCGKPTTVSLENDRKNGRIKGQACRFIRGHSIHLTTVNHGSGYVMAMSRNHPRANAAGYVLQHILIAESVLHRPLPAGSEIHHLDGNKANNNHANLVICEDRAFHMLLHMRQRALKKGHPAHWRCCSYCHQHDSPENLCFRTIRKKGIHLVCERLSLKIRRAKRKERPL